MNAPGARRAGLLERLAATTLFKVVLGSSVLVAVLLLASGAILVLGLALAGGESAALAAAGVLLWVLAGVGGLLGLGYGGAGIDMKTLTRPRLDVAIVCLTTGVLAAVGVLVALAAMAMFVLLPVGGAMRFGVEVFTGGIIGAAHVVLIVAACARALRLTRLYEARTGTRFDVLPVTFLSMALAKAAAVVAVTILISG